MLWTHTSLYVSGQKEEHAEESLVPLRQLKVDLVVGGNRPGQRNRALARHRNVAKDEILNSTLTKMK
jgi:hypothetical protein